MNQQRSRRFRASKESREKKEAMKNRREEMAAAGTITFRQSCYTDVIFPPLVHIGDQMLVYI